jgi:aminomethyltransferase
MTDATTAAPAPVAAAVLDYGDAAAEYAALRTGALLVDHSARDLWLFGGAQARATLTGLVTNDVAALAPGHGCYAAALTPKGRIVADVRVYAAGPDGAAGARLPDPARRRPGGSTASRSSSTCRRAPRPGGRRSCASS